MAASGSDIVTRLKAFARAKAPAAPTPKTVNGTRSRAIGVAAGYDLTNADFNDLGGMFSTHAKSVTNPGQTGHMFRLTREFEESRQLGFNVDANNQKMNAWFGPGQGRADPARRRVWAVWARRRGPHAPDLLGGRPPDPGRPAAVPGDAREDHVRPGGEHR